MMNDFISKPFAPNNLLNTIQNYVNSSKLAIKNSLKGNSLLDYNRLTQLYGNDKEYAADMFQTFLIIHELRKFVVIQKKKEAFVPMFLVIYVEIHKK